MKNKVRILSIDGGGIRGIIPAVVLEYVEQKLKEKSGNPDAVLHDYFDMIAGTSTGGILTCFYLHPARFPAEQAIDLYVNKGSEIFKRKWKSKANNWIKNWVCSAKYTKTGLEKALNDTFGESKLSDVPAGKHSLVTAYDIVKCKSEFFTVPAAKRERSRDFYLRDIARATSAAPTYFDPVSIRSVGYDPKKPGTEETHYLIDGAMFANDPSLCAIVEARKTWFEKCGGFPAIKDVYLVSIGTGKEMTPLMLTKSVNWGKFQWIKPVIDILMWGSPEVVNCQLTQFFELAGCSDCYVRLNPGLHNASPKMDAISRKNIENLNEAGEYYVEKNKEVLDKIADELIDN